MLERAERDRVTVINMKQSTKALKHNFHTSADIKIQKDAYIIHSSAT